MKWKISYLMSIIFLSQKWAVIEKPRVVRLFLRANLEFFGRINHIKWLLVPLRPLDVPYLVAIENLLIYQHQRPDNIYVHQFQEGVQQHDVKGGYALA